MAPRRLVIPPVSALSFGSINGTCSVNRELTDEGDNIQDKSGIGQHMNNRNWETIEDKGEIIMYGRSINM